MNAKFFDSVFFTVLFLLFNPVFLVAMDPARHESRGLSRAQLLQKLSEKHRQPLLKDFSRETIYEAIESLELNRNSAYQAFSDCASRPSRTGAENNAPRDQSLDQVFKQHQLQEQIEQEFVIALFCKIAERKREEWWRWGRGCGYATAGMGAYAFIVGMCVTMLLRVGMRPCP